MEERPKKTFSVFTLKHLSLSLDFISTSFKNKNKRKIRELSKNVSFNTFN